MKGQKSSRLDKVEQQLHTIGGVLSRMIDEINNLKDLSVGTVETLKRLEGYEDAVAKLKEELETPKENVE